jgi:hypothetical protein
MSNKPRVTPEELIKIAADWWALNGHGHFPPSKSIVRGARLAIGSHAPFEKTMVPWASELLQKEYSREYWQFKSEQILTPIERALDQIWVYYFEAWSSELQKLEIEPNTQHSNDPNNSDEISLLKYFRKRRPNITELIRKAINLSKNSTPEAGVKKAWKIEAVREPHLISRIPNGKLTYWALMFDVWELRRTERAKVIFQGFWRTHTDLGYYDPQEANWLDN